MDDHARRLIQDDNAFVFVHDIQRNIFRKSLERRQSHWSGDSDLFSAAQPQRRFGQIAIDQNLLLFDQLPNANAANFRKLRGKPMVEALASGLMRNKESVHWKGAGFPMTR